MNPNAIPSETGIQGNARKRSGPPFAKGAMTATHTPGPWRATGKEVSPDRPGSMRVCTCTDQDEAEANARLIAAAPAMLAALRNSLIDGDEVRAATLVGDAIRLAETGA